MSDLFGKVNAGDPIRPSARTWNAMTDAARAFQRGEYGGGASFRARPETSAEVDVSNPTGADVGQFGVLGIAGPLITQAASPATFYGSRSLTGAAPAANTPFVITQEPIGNGKIGRATLLGRTPCKVNLTSTAHEYAAPTTSTTELTSAASGPARILWVESDDPGPRTTGSQWAIVNLTGFAPTIAKWKSSWTPTFVTINGAVPTHNYPAALSTDQTGLHIITGFIEFSGVTSGDRVSIGIGADSGAATISTPASVDACFAGNSVQGVTIAMIATVAIAPATFAVFLSGIFGAGGASIAAAFGLSISSLSGPQVNISFDGGTW